MRERTMTSLDYHRQQRAAERTEDYKARRLRFYVVEAPDGTRLAGPTETRERAEWLQARVGGEIRYVDNSPPVRDPAVVRFADGCASWLGARTPDETAEILDAVRERNPEPFEGAYVTRRHVVRLDVPGYRRLVFDPDTGQRIPSYLDCPTHRPKAHP